MLLPFDEQDQAGLRFLGFTIDVRREQGELAVVAGQMKATPQASRADQSNRQLTGDCATPFVKRPGAPWLDRRPLSRLPSLRP
jgi:hypothetical protein